MTQIKLQDIIIKPDRQRQEFEPEALQELKNSIEERGLMHPPVLRNEDGQWVLVAGERRLRAMTEIFQLSGGFNHNGHYWQDGWVPFTDIGELTELEAEECELDENLKRANLTWQEHAAAVRKLHMLRQKQQQTNMEEALESGELSGDASETAAKFPQHTIADTAEELTGKRDGYYQDITRKEILVAKHLDNPEVAGAKDVKEAFKVLQRQETSRKNVELARTVGATFNADLHCLLNVDCLEYMASEAISPEASTKFDVICTDPPYGMGADNFGDAGGKMTGIQHKYDDSYESWKPLMKAWCDLSFLICKPQAHAYVFCDFDRFHELKAFMQAAGWYVFRTPLVNHKMNSGRVPLPDQGPRRQYELVLYAIKGKKPVTHIYPDVFSATSDENLSHGAQKPVAVYQNLLQRSVKPGDRIFDGFAGSGGIFEAGHGFKCTVVGCEKTEEYYGMSLRRLQALKQLETPDIFAGLQ